MPTAEIGSLRFWYSEARKYAGEAPGGAQATADARVFVVKGPDHLHLEVADIRWRNGERSIETLRVVEGSTQMRRLAEAGRLTVFEVGDDVRFDLRLARLKLNNLPRWRSALFQCTADDLNLATGLDAGSILRAAGADRIGPRSALIADSSTHKNHLMAMGSAAQDQLPITGYLLTRVLPMLHMVYDAGSTQLAEYVVPEQAKDDLGGRLYVVLLDPQARAGSARFDEGYCNDRGGTCVYVGCTGKPREHRFREHIVGYKQSRWVYQFGVRLMPELWQGTRTNIPAGAYAQHERELALRLAAEGYCVRGGH